MQDKGHCMMPFDNDKEFEFFYDFSRAYRDFPQKTLALENATREAESSFNLAEERKIAAEQRAANASKSVNVGSKKKDKLNSDEANEEESPDDWEDCDVDDDEAIQEASSDDEEEKNEGNNKTESGYEIINQGDSMQVS